MKFRRFRAADKGAVIAVLHASYDGWQGARSDAYWAWKFEQNPHGRALIWVGDDDGRIAGCYIWMPVLLRVGNATITGAQSVDAAVHPDYRGRSVFGKLARAAVEDAPQERMGLIYAFPTEGAFRGQVRVGFTPQFAVPGVHRPLLPGIGTARRRRFPGLELRTVTGFDAGFGVFSANGRDGELAVQRDPDYLQWRYCEHPTRTYETIVCEERGELRGYCVLTVDERRGYIADLQVLPGSQAAADCLAEHALRRLAAMGARLAVTWRRPSGPEQQALHACGFSSRYRSAWRRLKRAGYNEQFIAYEGPDGPSQLPPGQRPRWSLVPGDADYV